jgi:chaperonin GroES
MNLKPLHDWAVIRPSDAQEMTASGLYIPDTAQDKPYEGTVIAIGPGALEEEKYGKKKEEGKERKFIPTTIKPGDLVLYGKYAGQTYTISGEDLVLVRERDILGCILDRPVGVKPKPLQIPAVTTAQATTLPVKRPAAPLMKRSDKTAIQVVKKTETKPSVKKKVAKKTVKKAVKKTSTKKGQGAGGKGPGKPKPASKATAKKIDAKKSKKAGKKK